MTGGARLSTPSPRSTQDRSFPAGMASTSVVLGGMSRPYRRPVVLGVTLVLSVVALARFGILLTILVMVIGVTAAVLVGRHQAAPFTVRKKGARATGAPP